MLRFLRIRKTSDPLIVVTHDDVGLLHNAVNGQEIVSAFSRNVAFIKIVAYREIKRK